MSKRLARNSLFGALSGLCQGFGGFISTVLVARLLGVDGTGEFGLAVWVGLLAATIADVGFSASLSRYIPELMHNKAEEEARALAWLLIRLGIFGLLGILITFAVVALINFDFLKNFFSSIGWMLVGILAASQFLLGLGGSYLRGYQRFEAHALFSAAKLILQPSAVCVGALIAGTEGALVGYVAGNFIFVLCFIGFKKRRVPVSAKLRARVRRYSIYSWASAITTTLVWGRFEIVFLSVFTGLGAVGLFTVATSFTAIIDNLLLLVTTGLLPHFSATAYSAGPGVIQSQFRTVVRTLAFVAFPVCIGTAAICEPVFLLLYGEAFEAAVPAAIVLLLVTAINGAVAPVGGSIVRAYERNDFIFYANLFGAFITIIGCLALVPMFGLMGAVAVRALVQLSLTVSAIWFLETRLQISMPFSDLARLLLAAIAAAVAAQLALGFFDGLAGLPIAVTSGAVAYFVTIRIMKCIPPGDIDRFLLLTKNLPQPLPVIGLPIMKVVFGAGSLQKT